MGFERLGDTVEKEADCKDDAVCTLELAVRDGGCDDGLVGRWIADFVVEFLELGEEACHELVLSSCLGD